MTHNIDFSDLPRNANQTIAWKKSIGSVIYVGDDRCEVKILNYHPKSKNNSTSSSLTVEYNGKTKTILIRHIRDGEGFSSLIGGMGQRPTDLSRKTKPAKNKNGTDKRAIVDLDNLRDADGNLDWANSEGKYIRYTYMNDTGEILVKQVIDDKDLILERDGRQRVYSIASIMNGQIIKLVNSSGEQAKRGITIRTYKVGEIISNKKSQFLVLSVSYRCFMNSDKKELNKGHVYYYVRCLECGATFYKSAYNLTGSGCPVCSNMKLFQGVNDIPSTAPWLIDYFQGGIEEAKKYHCGQTKKIYPKCPLCGRVHDKQISIANLSHHGFQCSCSDSIKYPEKFMINLLEQCGVKFLFQPTSIRLPFDAKNKRYDFYIPDYSAIIEAHGGQHYKEQSPDFNTTKEAQEKNDYEKYMLAKDFVSHYFVIDCRKSDLNWIKTSVCASGLLDMLNISETEIDWTECSKFAMSNISKAVCDYYNENDVTIHDLCQRFHIGEHGITTYLKHGAESGRCKYVPTKSFFSMIPFEVYKDGQFICYGKSSESFSRSSKNVLGVHLDHGGIRKCLIGDVDSYKGFVFKKIQDYKLKREVLCRNDCF